MRVHAVTVFPWVANSPRAHITNQRAAEVLRDLGVEEDAKRLATPWQQMGDTLFTTSLAGEEIVRLQTWGTGDLRQGDYLTGSPCTMLDVPQPLMEPILLNKAAERGAVHQLQHRVPRPRARTTTVSPSASATAAPATCSPSAPATCSGSTAPDHASPSSSSSRSRASSPGPAPRTSCFNADLAQYVAHRPSILHWIMNSKAGFGEIGMGLLRAIKPWNEWIAGWGFDMAAGEPDFSDDVVTEQIRTLVGDPDLEIEILTKSLWYVNQQHATDYSKGRVLCGGDAVHRHPPSSGLGSNTSMQDAFNLAWKVAFAVKGYAGQGLLESYSAERAPVGEQIVARANQSRKDYAGLREWFDSDADGPGRRRPARLKAPTAEGVALRDQPVRGAGAEEHRVQRPRRRAQPALRVQRRPPRPHRGGGAVARATASCTCRRRPVPAPSCAMPGWSARRPAGVCPPSTSPARAS